MEAALVVLAFPLIVNAEGDMTKKVYEACNQEQRIEVCTNMQNISNVVKKKVDKTLKKYNIQGASAVVTGAVQLATGGDLKLRMGEMPVVNNDRTIISLSKDKVVFAVEWTMD